MTVINLLVQLSIAVPLIIAATMSLTAAIHGIFDIKKDWVNHLISWIIAVAVAEGFVACGQLDFTLGGWNYAVGAVAGLIVGGTSNGIFDWAAIKKFFDLITEIFKPTK